MITTYSEVVDEIQGMLKDVWTDGRILVIAGYQPLILWPGMPNVKPDNSKIWARPSFKCVYEDQQTLASENGVRRFESIYLFYLQIFCPKNEPDTVVNGRKIAEIVRSKYRHPAPSGNVAFSGQEIRELDPTDLLYPFNVKVKFTFETAE